MMPWKILLLVLMLLIPSNLNAQEPTPAELAEQIAELRQELEQRRAVSDSLGRELYKFRTAAEFFDSALDEQANRFALITASILALVGLISWGGFRWEVSRVAQKFEDAKTEQEDRFSTTSQRIQESEWRLADLAADTYYMLAWLAFTEADPRRTLSLLLATESQLRAWELEKGTAQAAATAETLEFTAAQAAEALDQMPLTPEAKDTFVKDPAQAPHASRAVQALIMSDFPALRKLAMQVRTKTDELASLVTEDELQEDLGLAPAQDEQHESSADGD